MFSWLADRFSGKRVGYVIVNVCVAGIVFVRNFLFMKWLNLSDLGQIAIAQTIIMLISLLQFGLVNGGYRIYASKNAKENRSVNDLIFSYILLLSVVSGGGCAFCLGLISGYGVFSKTIFLAVAAGNATLAANWINNCLIADDRFGLSNVVNLVASLVSLIIVVETKGEGLGPSLLALMFQPLTVVVLTLIFHRSVRPRRLSVSVTMLKKILSLGFVPFVGGLLALLTIQLERWSIISLLGGEQLGRFYIVILYASIYALVPGSLLNVYYPRAIREFEKDNVDALMAVLKLHSIDLFRFVAFALLVTVLFMRPVVLLLLPRFSGTLNYVYWAMPGIVVTSLCDVLALYYNAIKRLRPLLWFGLTGVLSYGVLLCMLHFLGKFSLVNVVIVRTASSVIAALLLFWMHRNDVQGERGKHEKISC